MSICEKIFFAIVFIGEVIIFAVYIHHNEDKIANWIKEHTPKGDTFNTGEYCGYSDRSHEFWMPLSGGHLLSDDEIHIPYIKNDGVEEGAPDDDD